MPAGRAQVEPGEKLRFKLALPADQEGLAALLTPSKGAVKEALAERRARLQQQGGQQQPQVVVVDAASSGQRRVLLETAKCARCAQHPASPPQNHTLHACRLQCSTKH